MKPVLSAEEYQRVSEVCMLAVYIGSRGVPQACVRVTFYVALCPFMATFHITMNMIMCLD